ncbi:sigma factor [Niabella hibiscisoli]|uniref:sigma factor n=1 Tax=Niabella hibiscisoli TaxID=1825928 RepID=UPI001F1065A6|nr:sigma factor [Niabella hibiscisoli]MCH5720248.1 hypothetical protein [Niabella hibiscisoli]
MIDSQLITSLQTSVSKASDEVAYKKLYYYFHPLLRRFAFNLLGNTEIADEIVSDVLLKLWIMREKMDMVQDLKLYLFKATQNACLNYLKSATHRNNLLTEQVTEQDAVYSFTESEYTCSEIQQLIANAVNQLPPNARWFFVLLKSTVLAMRR